MILINRKFHCQSIAEISEFSQEGHLEVCATKIIEINTIILSVYRSPLGDINTFLEGMEEVLSKLNEIHSGKLIIGGDYNINFLQTSKYRNLLIQLLGSYGLHPAFEEPSRVTTNSATCVDNIFNNLPKKVVVKQTINPHLSDHLAQMLSLNMPTQLATKVKIKFRAASKTNMDRLILSLQSYDWVNIVNTADPEMCFSKFNNVLKYFHDINIPTKYKYVNTTQNKINWYSQELKQMKNTLDALHVIMLQTKGEAEKCAYNVYKTDYKNKIYETKKEKNEDYIRNSSNKQKAIWNIIKSNSPNAKLQTHSNIQLTATQLNTFFTNVPSTTGNRNLARTLLQGKAFDSCSSFYMGTVDEEEVSKIIASLKNSSSLDYNGMSVKVLKKIAPFIIEPLTFVINRCLQAGVFPEVLKLAEVTPIYKSGDVNQPTSYRPISILPVISKIMESIIKNKLVVYLNKKKCFGGQQHGFLPQKSTTTAMLDIVDYISVAFDGRDPEMARAIYCDLSKAFDSISHEVLLDKLEYYGIRGIPLTLIKSYLKTRKQRVVFNGQTSKWASINSGVPQGSIIGPLLFILYMDDLQVQNISEVICLYADDVSLINRAQTSPELEQKTSKSLAESEHWFTTNALNMNKTKTKTITFKTMGLHEEPVKFLGVWFESDLRWKKQIEELAGKLSRSLFTLRSIMRTSTYQAALMCYYAVFHSYISYGIMVWGISPGIADILILQKRAVRVLSGAHPRDSCRELFVKNKLLTVIAVFIHTCVIYVHQNRDRFKNNNTFHQYDTRNSNQLCVEYHRVSRAQHSRNYWCIKLYNRLPAEVQNQQTLQFKNITKVILRKLCPYSVAEYMQADLHNFM